MPASRRGCYRRCCRYGSGPGQVTLDQKLAQQPKAGCGPGAAARAALQPLPLPDQHLPTPRAPNVMEARRSRAARRCSDLGLLGRAAAVPRAAEAGGGCRSGAEGEAAAAARPARSGGAAAKTPSAAVPGTARDLLFSFTKNEREKKEEGEEKQGEKIAAGTGTVTGTAHRGAPLVERGRGVGRGRGKKEIGRLRGPAPRRGSLINHK